MGIDWKKLLLSLAIPLGVGALASLLTGNYDLYTKLVQPPLSPPGWIFPIVWTALYLLMGYGSYRVWTAPVDAALKKKALTLYAAQLAANFIWPLLFFGAQWYLVSLLWLAVLWVLILLTMRVFGQVDERASDLLIPYLLWVTFALYLNFGIWLLNR